MNKIPIFIINLKKDIDKKNNMRQLCEQYGFDVEFIEAVDGSMLTKNNILDCYSPEDSIKIIGRRLSMGEIGCALSHISIYDKMVKENISRALILEDDIEMTDNFPDVLNLLKRVPEKIECLLLGHNVDMQNENQMWFSVWDQINIGLGYHALRFTKLAHGAYGYYITLQGAEKLLKATKCLNRPIDHYTGDENFIGLYGLSPRCIYIPIDTINKSRLSIERESLETPIAEKSIFYDSFYAVKKFRLMLKQKIKKYLPIKEYR